MLGHYIRLEGAISENGPLSFSLKRSLRNQKLRSLLLAKVGRSCVQLAFVLTRSAWSIFFVYSMKSVDLGENKLESLCVETCLLVCT